MSGLGSASNLIQLGQNIHIIKVYENIGDQCLLIPIASSMKGCQEEKTYFFKNKVYFITLILHSKRI